MSYRVLIVDDSPLARNFIRRILIQSGFAVQEFMEAGDGHAAIEILQTRPVDILLTDINMPAMNGEDLVHWIREDPDLSNLPVVIVSSDSGASRVQRLAEAGVCGYVSKPFSPETLRAEIDHAMGVMR